MSEVVWYVVGWYGMVGKARPGLSLDFKDGTVYIQVYYSTVSAVVPAVASIRPKGGATQQEAVHALCATFGGVVGIVGKSRGFHAGYEGCSTQAYSSTRRIASIRPNRRRNTAESGGMRAVLYGTHLHAPYAQQHLYTKRTALHDKLEGIPINSIPWYIATTQGRPQKRKRRHTSP